MITPPMEPATMAHMRYVWDIIFSDGWIVTISIFFVGSKSSSLLRDVSFDISKISLFDEIEYGDFEIFRRKSKISVITYY